MTDDASGDGDLGDALASLGDSMDDLSTDMTGLNDAISKLQASTRRLSDQQASVATEMRRTADTLSTLGEPDDAHSFSSSAGAAADD